MELLHSACSKPGEAKSRALNVGAMPGSSLAHEPGFLAWFGDCSYVLLGECYELGPFREVGDDGAAEATDRGSLRLTGSFYKWGTLILGSL